MSRKRSNPNRDANYLPPHVGSGFLNDLVGLVDYLADVQGPKGEYLKDEFLSKFCSHDTTPPEVRRAAAIQKWMGVEESNSDTNLRLYTSQCTEPDFGWTSFDRFISEVRAIIAKVLGPLDTVTLFQGGNHTNGASTRVKRSPSAALSKHVGEAHVTSSALRHWYTASAGTVLSGQPLKLVKHSVLFTVPKSSEIDRVACKEPEINMYLQRCAGQFIRKRLRRFGVDLNDQTINQRLAKDALRLHLATVDLSSASDSITKQLVQLLLPVEWWSLLDDLRVQSVSIDGTIHYPEMFSSMGNGFTFELESLLFWSMTRVIAKLSGVRGRINVYGDDIICPSKIGPRLARIFSFFGFKVNTKKSNWSGLFRESCGKHYHNGLEITPFYVRGPITSKTDVIRLLNRLLMWDGMALKCITTPEVHAFHMKWRNIIPKSLYGGRDPEMDSVLTTRERPRSRLLRKIRPYPFDQQAGLLLWLTVKETTLIPLSVDPGKDGRFFVAPYQPLSEHVTWDPDLVWGHTTCAHSS